MLRRAGHCPDRFSDDGGIVKEPPASYSADEMYSFLNNFRVNNDWLREHFPVSRLVSYVPQREWDEAMKSNVRRL